MNDYEQLKDLLTRFGVGFDEGKYKAAKRDGFLDSTGIFKDDMCHYIFCTAEEHDKVTGYFDFFTRFEFNSDGSFVRMGAWE